MVDALRTNGKPGLTWDRDLPGFGVLAYSTGRITYVVQSRGPSGSRRATLGQHGEVTPEEARRLAARVVDRIKTGPRWIPLTREALIVLDSQKQVPGNPWVFVGVREGTPVGDLTRFWIRLRKRMGLEDVRLHDLRHSYASRALLLGESLSIIGRLLGHSSIDTTARYAHLARDTEKASAARVAASIGADILG